jgi:hypothetical protein
MKKRAKELLLEIRHLKEQYEAEVGQGHKAWPKSIKERVIDLSQMGIGPGELAKLTGINYHTTLDWRRQFGLVRSGKKHDKSFHALVVLTFPRMSPIERSSRYVSAC